MQGYYQHPTVHGQNLVFVCEDDLWWADLSGGMAQRLTASRGRSRTPFFSPDGRYLAYTSRDEGYSEVYLLDSQGGEPRRLTFLAADTMVVGWSPDGQWIYYTSNEGQPFLRMHALGRVPAAGGSHQRMPWGPAASITFEPGGKGRALGRHTWDTARWKRYRGGTVGQFWVDRMGKDDWKALRPGGGNLTSPLWIGKRLYFGSDHDGHGHLYSCRPDGKDLRQHTEHQDFYLRRPNSDGETLVYQCGAQIYSYDLKAEEGELVDLRLRAAGFARQRKFTAASTYLDNYDLHPKGKALACTVRGKALSFYTHERGVQQLGEAQGVRYRQACWLADGERVLVVSDQSGEEVLEIYDWQGQLKQTLDLPVLGRPLRLAASPQGPWLALTNHRYELWLVNLETKATHRIEKNDHDRIPGLAWSPCGKFLAYSSPTGRLSARLQLVEVPSLTVTPLTDGRFRDVAPHFDPKGRHLYFLSMRDFNPVWDNMFFEMSFPNGMRPFLLRLQADSLDPFEFDPNPPEEPNRKKGRKQDKVEPTRIDLDEIEQRISAFPVGEGRFGQVQGCGDTVWFTRYPAEGTLEDDSEVPRGVLVSWEFKTQEAKDVYQRVTNFTTSQDGKFLCYRSNQRLRLVSVDKKPESNEDTPGRKSGWVSGNRLRVSIEPRAEWKQMAREAWRLMREHFWDAASGHDWEGIYQRYLPLLERVGCRSELSDWLWELQGELGTSHAYESGGDYLSEPTYAQGKLGAEFIWDARTKAYKVTRVLEGDCWLRSEQAPARRAGQWLRVGDLLTHVHNQRLSAGLSPEMALVNQARMEVWLQVRRDKTPLRLCLRPLRSETSLRYRDWVEGNRRWVHQQSGGRLGYVHVPNMGPWGFSEFHRGFFSEVSREGLVVDVRYNGGGNVSGLLLEKLSRRIVGWDVPRYGQPVSYPMEAPRGPIVALTNEMAGSDGDIFSHCFKLLGLGPLVGTRTWGGVIGIWPRHRLVDGTQTTQPEFAFWFEDVGWRVENYGTEPDERVEIRPQDWAAGRDPQLERALELGMERLADHRPLTPPPK